jgi:ribosomal protein S18 acetylase RimI-like enzyme
MNVAIEIPEIDDFKRVNELAKQVQELHVNWNPDLYVSVDEVLKKDYFENLIQNKEIFIAKMKNEIVGYVIFYIKEKENHSMRYRKQLNIEAICIDENCRGNGIGTLLLEHIKSIGKEQGCTDMYLTVNQKNESAIKVYEKFGFKVKNIAYIMKL